MKTEPHPHCRTGCPDHKHERVPGCALCIVSFGKPTGDAVVHGLLLDRLVRRGGADQG